MNKKFNGVLAVSVLLASSGAHAAEQNVIKKGPILRLDDPRFEGYQEALPTGDIMLIAGRGKVDKNKYKGQLYFSNGSQKPVQWHLLLQDATNEYVRLNAAYVQQEQKVAVVTSQYASDDLRGVQWYDDEDEKAQADLLKGCTMRVLNQHSVDEERKYTSTFDTDKCGWTLQSIAYNEFVKTSVLTRKLRVIKTIKDQSYDGHQFVVSHAICRSADGKKPFVSEWDPGDGWELAGNKYEPFTSGQEAYFHYDRLEKLYLQQQEQKNLIAHAHAGLAE